MYDPMIHQRTQAWILLNRSRRNDISLSLIRKIRANHLGSNLCPGAEAQFIHHAVQPSRQRLVFQLQGPHPQLQSFHPFLQGVDISSLLVNSTKELVLLLVDVHIPFMVAICHGLCICLDLSQVPLHLGLLPFQMIPLKESHHRSVQFDWNEEWRLTRVLSPAKRPQSLPTSTAKYLMDQVDPFQGLSTTLASITP